MASTNRRDVHIEVYPDARQLQRVLKGLAKVKNGAPRAVAAALNKTARGAITDIARTLAAEYTAKQKDIRRVLAVGRKASPSSLSASVKGTYRSIPLMDFRVRPRIVTKRRPRIGVTAEVKRGERKVIPYSFIAAIRGKPQVAMRVHSKKRVPIRPLFGPAVTHMMDTPEMSARLHAMAAARLVKNLDHEVERIQKGFGK